MRWLNAQVMLQSGHADAAYDLLKDDDSPQGRFLHYSARLKLMPQQAAKVTEAAEDLARQGDGPMLQGAIWGLAAQAAGESGQPLKRIRYLERALSLPIDQQLNRGVISYTADQLWDAYITAGKRIGNDEQKLLGNDEDWYFPATEAMGKDPLRARILFSVLAVYGSSPERRAVAHEYLVGLLDDLPNGKQLTRRLYLDSTRYADAGSLPSVIRYRLTDEALESGDLDTASRLMAGLAEPPAGSDRFEWDLRRARVAIYTGDTDTGVGLLQQLLNVDEQEWNEQRVDRLLQVVFDLQTVERHDKALALFSGLLDKPLAAQQRRELLFWMADSLQGLEHYDEAAYLYLKSATLIDPTAMDPWAQTARYRAAQSLVDAGLVEDARQIYGLLLRAAKDASRKAVLQNELQRLHLLSSTRQSGKGR
jgi:tetratricopeptide (TPR) repeat protein